MKTKITKQALIDSPSKFPLILPQLLGVGPIAEIRQFYQCGGHSGAPENKKRGIDPDAVIPGAYSLNNAIENVLSQPVGLGIGAVNIDLSAVDFGICVGIAVNADK